jgi:hypothetical protein
MSWAPTDAAAATTVATPDEIAEVNRTGRIFLSVMSGAVFYPVFLGSEGQVRSVVVDYGPVWERG